MKYYIIQKQFVVGHVNTMRASSRKKQIEKMRIERHQIKICFVTNIIKTGHYIFKEPVHFGFRVVLRDVKVGRSSFYE